MGCGGGDKWIRLVGGSLSIIFGTTIVDHVFTKQIPKSQIFCYTNFPEEPFSVYLQTFSN